MSKYKPLSDRLAGSTACEWRVSFAELAAMLGLALPKAARSGRNWWANEPAKSHSRAWIGQGWAAGDVDPSAGRVEFRRALPTDPEGPSLQAAAQPQARRPRATRGDAGSPRDAQATRRSIRSPSQRYIRKRGRCYSNR